MLAAPAPAATTIGVDASWIVVPVVVLVIALVAINALRAQRTGGSALDEVGRQAPHAVVSIVGTVLVAGGGGAAALMVGLLPFVIIVEALGAHVLGVFLLAMAAAVVTLLIGAALLGRGLNELLRRRR